MQPDPGVHRDAGGHPGVDGPGGAELGDGEDSVGGVAGRVRQTAALLPEQQHAGPGQLGGLERLGSGQVVHGQQRQVRIARPGDQRRDVGVMPDVLVAVGDHRPPPVPALLPDDVHRFGQERVRGSDDGADVQVVPPVLDGHVEGMPTAVEAGDDRLDGPVAVAVDDVAPVAVAEQLGVVPRIRRPRSDPGAHPDGVRHGLRRGEGGLGGGHPRNGSGTMDGAMTALPLVFDAPRRGMPPRHLADMTREEARAAVTELGHPAFRADQLARHFYRGVTDPAQMTDLPADARQALTEALLPGLLTVVRHQTADNGRTRKTLWRLHDGALGESVLMRYPDRATVCISSQAGCGMACPFCATGQSGLTRNLSAAEIIGQAVAAAAAMANGEIPRGPGRPCKPRVLGVGGPGRLSNVVFMGMGEPLANYARVRKTLDALLTPAPHGLGLSQRSVTVSTVGLVPAIRRLTDEGLHVTLAVSLHAPDDELRDTLVPINTRWKVDEVLGAADEYARTTGRRYSVEYALIRDVNDQPFRADLLGKLLKHRLAHVNLIPLNPTPGSPWDASPLPAQREFVARLRAAGVATTVRDTRGQEIDGACGQLAAADQVEGVPAIAVPTPSLEPLVELGAESDQ